MTIANAEMPDGRMDDGFVSPRWRSNVPHVRKLLKWVQTRKTPIEAEDLVEWDRAHGQKIFNWNDADAAAEYRLWEARLFMNRFRARFDGLRVRAFIHIREDEAAQIPTAGYVAVEAIAQHGGMRAQVVADITKRMASLASELRMWQLTEAEQASLFARLRAAMMGAPS